MFAAANKSPRMYTVKNETHNPRSIKPSMQFRSNAIDVEVNLAEKLRRMETYKTKHSRDAAGGEEDDERGAEMIQVRQFLRSPVGWCVV